MNKTALGYGLLLASFGFGAIAGAFAMQAARERWSTETVVSASVVILGLVMVAIGGLHRLSALAAVMLIGGAAWVIFTSLISALVQNLAPDWARSRVLAIFILVYQGSYAFGTVVWGAFAHRASVRTALVYAGIGMIANIELVPFAKIPDSTADLSSPKPLDAPVITITCFMTILLFSICPLFDYFRRRPRFRRTHR